MSEAPLTQWLRDAGNGDAAAAERAFALVHVELARIAARQVALNGASATLTPTALVNEAFLKLSGGALLQLNDRRHFFNLAARAMRQTAIDHARERLSAKRGGDLVRTELDDDVIDGTLDAQQTLALDQALHALEAQDAQLAETFGWRVFGGLDANEIATLRGVTVRTVNRDLALARAYLRHSLDGVE